MHAPQGPADRIRDDVLAKAAADADFRQRLLDDPDRALFGEFGISLPEGFRIRFIEKPADVDELIVLPDARTAAEELDDEDLDAAAGGGGDGGGDPPPNW
jgi:hypothetical protein